MTVNNLLPAALMSLLFSACNGGGQSEGDRPDSAPAGSPVRVSLALNWFPEAEHGGFYAALIHGLYRDAGLEVEILGGGPDAPVIQRVATGAVDFGISNADGVLNARAAQADVVAIMAPYQVNPRCIMVHASSGIRRIEDLADVTLALSQRPAFSHYLRWLYAFDSVDIVPYHGGITAFLLDPRYAQQAYLFSEPILARRQGANPRVLMVADIGFNPYGSTLIATRRTLAGRPRVARAMATASAAGWRQYLEAPDTTNRYINRLNPEMDLEILAEGARQSRALILTQWAAAKGIGAMTPDRWDTLQHQMERAGLLEPGAAEAAGAFSNAFLDGAAPGRRPDRTSVQ